MDCVLQLLVSPLDFAEKLRDSCSNSLGDVRNDVTVSRHFGDHRHVARIVLAIEELDPLLFVAMD